MSAISPCNPDRSQSCSGIVAGDEELGALQEPVAVLLEADAFSSSSPVACAVPCSWRISKTAKMSSLLS